jgi:Kef-type K+ transport system membrane component KefB/mannitol/fructose-specific phosphotransferase system IIA component (Ntr-type)
MPTSLPISDPVLIFGLAMGIFLLAPVLFERIRVPGLIGLIVFGVIVGPNVLNLLDRDFTIVLLGQVGLLYLVFLAGLELDLNRFQEYRAKSLGFGTLSFVIPAALAAAVMPLFGYSIPAALLVGAIVGSHTLLAYPVVSRLGIVKNPAMITVVGGTLVTDTLSLSVLAVISGAVVGELSALFWVRLFGSLILYVALVSIFVPRVGRWFFRNVPAQAPAEFIFLMATLFFVAWGARLAGAEPIIGAFLAGLTLNRLIPLNSPLMTRVRFVGNALFIPFFLLSVGMLVDPRVLVSSFDVWILASVLTALVLVGKFAGAWAAKGLYGFSKAEGLAMFGLSAPQAAATLAVTFVGLEIGLFGETMVNAVIVLIVITVFVGPSLVERFGREIARQEERRPYDPSEAPRRILIPIANPATADALMDIAFMLRDRTSEEPLFPLTVVRGGDQGSEARVADAEKMLAHAVLYAAGADVPVSPLTRVDQNIATGMMRAMAETRTSIVVVGWDGRSSGSRTAVFGTVLDQLLEQTRQTIIVAKMGHPLNTTRRIVLVVPESGDRHPGFAEGASLIKRLAGEIDASLEVLVVGDAAETCKKTLEKIRPTHPLTVAGVDGWGPLLWELRSRLDRQDLVVVLSARRGALSWSRELERLPAQLSSLVPESFLMLYPAEADLPMASGGAVGIVGDGSTESGTSGSLAGGMGGGASPDRAGVGGAEDGIGRPGAHGGGEEGASGGLPGSGADGGLLSFLPDGLTAGRMHFDLSGVSYRDALHQLLGTHLEAGADRAMILDRLVASEEEFSSEIREGVALPHAMIPGLEGGPLLFLGISPEGIRFPNAKAPANVVLMLVGSSERTFEHLRILTRMARILRAAPDLSAIRTARSAEDVAGWFRAVREEARLPRPPREPKPPR